jgi:hypothetical protein
VASGRGSRAITLRIRDGIGTSQGGLVSDVMPLIFGQRPQEFSYSIENVVFSSPSHMEL